MKSPLKRVLASSMIATFAMAGPLFGVAHAALVPEDTPAPPPPAPINPVPDPEPPYQLPVPIPGGGA